MTAPGLLREVAEHLAAAGIPFMLTGSVAAAFHKYKRKVALKLLKPELAAVLGAERFVQEIATTTALQHPHILPLFDSGTAHGFLYYVMPFIDGETLRDSGSSSSLDSERQLTSEVDTRSWTWTVGWRCAGCLTNPEPPNSSRS